jgi:hypothetical protein
MGRAQQKILVITFTGLLGLILTGCDARKTSMFSSGLAEGQNGAPNGSGPGRSAAGTPSNGSSGGGQTCVLAVQDTTSGIFASTAPNQAGIIDTTEGNTLNWSVYQANGQPFDSNARYIFTGTKNGAADMTGGAKFTYQSPSAFNGPLPSGSSALYTRSVEVTDASGNVLCQSTGSFTVNVHALPPPSKNTSCTLSVVPSSGVTVSPDGSNITIQTMASGTVPVTYAVTSSNLFVNAVWFGSGINGGEFAGALNLVSPTDFTYNYAPAQAGSYTRFVAIEDDGVAICSTNQLNITVLAPQSPPPPPSGPSCVLAVQDTTSGIFASTAPNQAGIIDTTEGNTLNWSVYQANGQPFPTGSLYVFTGTKNGAADMTGGAQFTYPSPSVFNGPLPSGSAGLYTRAAEVTDAAGNVLCQSTGTFTINVHAPAPPAPAPGTSCSLSVVPSAGVTVSPDGSHVTIQTSSSGSVPVTYAVTSSNLFVNAVWYGSGINGGVFAGALNLVAPTDFTYDYAPNQAGNYTRYIVVEDDGVAVCSTNQLTITVLAP